MAKASILLKLMEALQLNNYNFEQEIKAANGSIKRLLDNDRDISKNLINKIRLRYPDVSEEWLKKGRGPMRAKPTTQKQQLLAKIKEIEEHIEELRGMVKEIKKVI